jgi:hypothetical protein
MKKARIALTAIALFAVIGGALAIKAKYTSIIYTAPASTTTGVATPATATTSSVGVRVYWTNVSTDLATNYSYTISSL